MTMRLLICANVALAALGCGIAVADPPEAGRTALIATRNIACATRESTEAIRAEIDAGKLAIQMQNNPEVLAVKHPKIGYFTCGFRPIGPVTIVWRSVDPILMTDRQVRVKTWIVQAEVPDRTTLWILWSEAQVDGV